MLARPRLTALLLTALGCSGCGVYTLSHQGQWDSRTQIWRAEASQVKVRAAQSRVFELRDKELALRAAIETMQDLGFQVEVLDEALGLVSGKKFTDRKRPSYAIDPYYYLYDGESLVVFTKAYRSWGPFWHRSDLVRLTVTLRARGEGQLVVRASAQHDLLPIESPEPYQAFFRSFEQALFFEQERIEREQLETPSTASDAAAS